MPRFLSKFKSRILWVPPVVNVFNYQLKTLIFYHPQEYSSGIGLLQALEHNDFAKVCVAPPNEFKKSFTFEAIKYQL